MIIRLLAVFSSSLFFTAVLSATTIEEQYNAIQNNTISSLELLNHNFFEKLDKNIQCSSSEPILMNDKGESVQVKVDYKCILNAFDVFNLDGFSSYKETELIDIKENKNNGLNTKIVDQYFERVQKTFVIRVGLEGTEFKLDRPFFYSNYTENFEHVVFHAESMNDSIEFEIPKNKIKLIKNSYILPLWTNGKPSELLKNDIM